MKENTKWFIVMGLLFVALSVAVYYLFFLIFHETEFIYHHFMVDLAFLPLEVYLVATVFENLIRRREKAARSEKLNVIIGSFYSDVGTELIKIFAKYNPTTQTIGRHLLFNSSWTKSDFAFLKSSLKNVRFDSVPETMQLHELKELLNSGHGHLLRLLENDNLLENESFTQLILALHHLAEELHLRKDLNDLPPSDYEHLGGDMERVYVILINQWIEHLQYLQASYPFLFSLAVRTNPFNPGAVVEIGINHKSDG